MRARDARVRWLTGEVIALETPTTHLLQSNALYAPSVCTQIQAAHEKRAPNARFGQVMLLPEIKFHELYSVAFVTAASLCAMCVRAHQPKQVASHHIRYPHVCVRACMKYNCHDSHMICDYTVKFHFI